ncbi:MAG: UTP--glucose-1-phosphate uridylyltransferase GalU [Rhizobiales bacterium]|nr:UTP--glucose-1-phosphate uridylyltransferase GalU [Hyphomicrobiales bacterium]
MPSKIRTAVLPVAGMGTRFLPATKAIPKEMLTVVDKPVVQYVVEEAREAGIEHIVFVTGRYKGAIEEHFDIHYELEATLKERNKKEALAEIASALAVAGTTSFTRQQAPLGLGHAVWCARQIVGREPFALLLPDMLKSGEPGCLVKMMDAYEKFGGNVVAVEECPAEEAFKYGVVGIGAGDMSGFEITKMVEKPAKGSEPSNLFISGRYILQPEIFDLLEDQKPGAGNEIQLTDAMVRLAGMQRFTGVKFEGEAYDCGTKVGFLAANVAFALKRPDIAPEFMTELRKILGQP